MDNSQPHVDQGNRENGNLILLFIYRTPKENYEEMVSLNNRVIETFRRYGVQRFEIFRLDETQDMMEFVNIAKTIAANKDEDVWQEIQSYRNHKHLEEVGIKMKNDKDM
jgi:hypothetical protein